MASGTSPSGVTLDVTDPQGRSFSGLVPTTLLPTGAAVCGQDCQRATGTVTVQ